MKEILLILLAMIFGAGCANFNECVKYNKISHPQTLEQYEKIIKAMEENSLRIWMSEKEVIELIGEPQEKNTQLFTKWIIWKYTSHGKIYDLFITLSRPLMIWFENGKVVKFQRTLQF
ncbi:MAG: hypothetical protein QME83_00880 [Thermodesulfobacteriota bacterium]|nr:hypothetical protein [Thermodesulfobacteriota bacterium]